MKKIIYTFFLLFFFVLGFSIVVLSTIGIETKKFNSLVSNKINQTNNSINLQLNKIKFKIDIKEMSLFLETIEPKIDYKTSSVPAKNIKVYIDFTSLVKSKPKIKKINLSLHELGIDQLKELIIFIKPSNFNSLVSNKIKQGKLISEIEFYFDKNNLIEDFIAKGSVSDLNIEIMNNLILQKTNFSFFADKTDILIKNIFGELEAVKIKNGDIKIRLLPEISLQSNFLTNLKYKDKSSEHYFKLIKNYQYAKDVINLEASINNDLLINFDKTYKVKNYSFTSNGKISKANFKFKKPITNSFFEEEINELYLIDTLIKTNFNSKNNNTDISGRYSIKNKDFLAFDLKNNIDKNLLKLEMNIEYDKNINLDIINYQKSKGLVANLLIDLEKVKNKIKINKLNFNENNNFIIAEDLVFNKEKLLSFKKISIETNINGNKNNDFSILYGKKIKIKGSQFDASNFSKILKQKKNSNILSKINKAIEIDFTNIKAPLSENLKNFKLIGLIDKGKFTKVISKGDFGNNNFLDISLKNDKKNKKKYLEIYSDLPKPLLTEYSFFKGLTGGKLLFTSIIDDKNSNSNSKLKIENFKVVNAPGMVKLFSLADLGGLADLAEGEGLTFDVLEINMSNDKGFVNFNEIIAIGPSISVLMDGYQNQNGLTSLRGTLVPAKNLNKLISKIPVLGDIIIPKEAGEGLFGISFKMKGLSGNIKTTINPIRTLTPRFIQKIVEKKKKSK
jgi:hypothetical protein